MTALGGGLSRLAKGLERLGKRLIVRVLGRCLRAGGGALPTGRERALRLLVIRLDPRLGNVLMTTPLLTSLRERYPDAAIDCLVHPYAARVLADHPAKIRALPYRRWAWLGAHGPWRRLRALRRQAYDLCFDATNPTCPSATQALMARAAGARCTIGYDVAPVAPLYHLRIATAGHDAGGLHEIERRLALLSPLGVGPLPRLPSVGPLARAARAPMRAFVEQMHGRPFVVLNLGARAAARRVSAADGATVANLCKSLGFAPVLVAGIGEKALCQQVLALSLDVMAAPDANLADLALLFSHATATVSGDTGPMHLSVAVGCPTLGIFSASCPHRYGYRTGPHEVVDARGQHGATWAGEARLWLAARQRAWAASLAHLSREPSVAGWRPEAVAAGTLAARGARAARPHGGTPMLW